MDCSKALSSPAQAAITRCLRVSFLPLRWRCILLRWCSSRWACRRSWSMASSSSILAYRSSSSSESLSDCSVPSDSSSLPFTGLSTYLSSFFKAKTLRLPPLKSSVSVGSWLLWLSVIFLRNSCFFCRAEIFFCCLRSSRRRLSISAAKSSSKRISLSLTTLSASLALSSASPGSFSAPCRNCAIASSTSLDTVVFSASGTPLFALGGDAFLPFASAFAAASAATLDFTSALSVFSRSRRIRSRHFMRAERSRLPRIFKSAQSSRISLVVRGCSEMSLEPAASKLSL
mmetsp:Transcript_46314/g.122984  ORF Transcript_46314/g.122984 Transcript_46314/m.122984 type:complete len:287 (-) Transcript_46314:895-1755(-)